MQTSAETVIINTEITGMSRIQTQKESMQDGSDR